MCVRERNEKERQRDSRCVLWWLFARRERNSARRSRRVSGSGAPWPGHTTTTTGCCSTFRTSPTRGRTKRRRKKRRSFSEGCAAEQGFVAGECHALCPTLRIRDFSLYVFSCRFSLRSTNRRVYMICCTLPSVCVVMQRLDWFSVSTSSSLLTTVANDFYWLLISDRLLHVHHVGVDSISVINFAHYIKANDFFFFLNDFDRLNCNAIMGSDQKPREKPLLSSSTSRRKFYFECYIITKRRRMVFKLGGR